MSIRCLQFTLSLVTVAMPECHGKPGEAMLTPMAPLQGRVCNGDRK